MALYHGHIQCISYHRRSSSEYTATYVYRPYAESVLETESTPSLSTNALLSDLPSTVVPATHLTDAPSLCAKRPSLPDGVTPIASNKRRHKCLVCGKLCVSTSHLLTHERTHTGEKPYSCQHCEKSFATKSELTIHKRTHTGEKPYSCQQCGKSFTQRSHLHSHKCTNTGVSGTHFTDAPSLCAKLPSLPDDVSFTASKRCRHKCSVCGKLFVGANHLLIHARTHTGEKPYSCQYCDKAFATKHNLTTHERSHTGEKPYSCQHCAKAFAVKQALTTHERTHTGEKPYSCQHCGKAFAVKQALNRHERTHTGGQHCGKAFTQQSHLNSHKCTHTVVPATHFTDAPQWRDSHLPPRSAATSVPIMDDNFR